MWLVCKSYWLVNVSWNRLSYLTKTQSFDCLRFFTTRFTRYWTFAYLFEIVSILDCYLKSSNVPLYVCVRAHVLCKLFGGTELASNSWLGIRVLQEYYHYVFMQFKWTSLTICRFFLWMKKLRTLMINTGRYVLRRYAPNSK